MFGVNVLEFNSKHNIASAKQQNYYNRQPFHTLDIEMQR